MSILEYFLEFTFLTQSEDFAKAIADFQNSLISGIFGVFSSGFLHRTTLNDL